MSKLNKGGPGCTCSTIKMGSWIMNKDHKTQSTALQRRWEICKMPRKQMQKPKPPSSSVKLEANFPISNVSKALNKTWTLNVENRLLHQHSSWKHYKQHLSAKLLLQTARQEEKSRTSLFFLLWKEKMFHALGTFHQHLRSLTLNESERFRLIGCHIVPSRTSQHPWQQGWQH